MLVPPNHSLIPGHAMLAFICGILFILAGACLVFEKKPRQTKHNHLEREKIYNTLHELVADIRNKLSPFWNLVALLKDEKKEDSPFINKYVWIEARTAEAQQEIIRTDLQKILDAADNAHAGIPQQPTFGLQDMRKCWKQAQESLSITTDSSMRNNTFPYLTFDEYMNDLKKIDNEK